MTETAEFFVDDQPVTDTNPVPVKVTNPPPATDVTALAKDATLTGGDVKAQITSSGGVTAFVKTSDPGPTDPGVVVRQAGPITSQANLRVAGQPVTDTNAVPTKTWLFDPDGSAYTPANPLPVNIGSAKVSATFASAVSVGNSTQTPLAANATFTGVFEDVKDYAAITGSLVSDVPSATDGLVAEFALDQAGTTIVARQVTTYPGGGVGAYFAFPPEARYVRIRYTNGPTAQAYLRSAVEYEFTAPTTPLQALGAPMTDLNIGAVMRSAVSGRQANGTYVPLRTTASGQLATVIEGVVTVNKANGHTTGTLTAANAISGAAQNNTAGASRTVVVHAIPDGHSSSTVELTAYSPTSQVVFEQSETGLDGTWAATNMRRNNTPDVNENYSQIENNPYGTSSTQVWKGTVGGIKYLRVRCANLAASDAAGIGVTIETSEGVGGTFLLGNPPSVSDYFQTGTLAAPGDTVECKAGGMGSFASLFSGQWTGKVQIEQTIDGITWRPTRALLNSNGDAASSIAGTNIASQVLGARGAASGVRAVRLRADTDFVGSLSGTLRTGAGSLGGFLTSAVQIGGLSQGSQTMRQAVGTTAVRVDPSALTNRTSVEVRAMSSNTTSVYVGFNSSVTVNTGRELLAGEAWTLDVTTATLLYAVASATGQQVQVTELG